MRNIQSAGEVYYSPIDRELNRRERLRLIKNETITPAYRIPPQLMVRNPDVKGGWSPELRIIEAVASCEIKHYN